MILVAFKSMAQDTSSKKSYNPENWFIGGSVSFSLGGYNNTFVAGLHPHYGYTLASWLDAAVVVNFEYSSAHDAYNNKYHNTTYGLGVFGRIFPVKFIFVQVEPEYNYTAVKYIPSGGVAQKQKVGAPSVLLGAGYTTSRSDKNSFTYVSVLIDVLKDPNSPYVDGYLNLIPIIRAGINIGLNRHH